MRSPDEDAKLRELRLSGEGLPNSALMAERGRRARAGVDNLVSLLIQTERLRVFCNQVLKITQPSSLNGRIEVRWWILRGRDDVPMPGLTRMWRQPGQQRRRGRPMLRVRRDLIYSKGTASINAQRTYTVARLALKLCVDYKAMRKALEYALSFTRRETKAKGRIDATELMVAVAHQLAVDDLIAHGYDVDAKSRDLSEVYMKAAGW